MSEDRPLRDRVALPPPRSMIGPVIKLIAACLLVGALLAIFRIDPVELWLSIFGWIKSGAVDLFGTGIEGIGLIITLFATGAVIVIPIWLINRLLSWRRR